MITLTLYESYELFDIEAASIQAITPLLSLPERTRIDGCGTCWVVNEKREEILGQINSETDRIRQLQAFAPMRDFIQKCADSLLDELSPGMRNEACAVLNLTKPTVLRGETKRVAG
jgi:hypothetical protein